MILLLWFYVTGVPILIGGEVNAEIENAAAKHGVPEAKEKGEKKPGTKPEPRAAWARLADYVNVRIARHPPGITCTLADYLGSTFLPSLTTRRTVADCFYLEHPQQLRRPLFFLGNSRAQH